MNIIEVFIIETICLTSKINSPGGGKVNSFIQN